MLHQMRAKTVTQSVRRNVRHARRLRMSLDDLKSVVPRHRSPAMQKQLGLPLITELFSDGQISLQPMNCAPAQGNAPLFVAFAVTVNQRGVQIYITGFQSARF